MNDLPQLLSFSEIPGFNGPRLPTSSPLHLLWLKMCGNSGFWAQVGKTLPWFQIWLQEWLQEGGESVSLHLESKSVADSKGRSCSPLVWSLTPWWTQERVGNCPPRAHMDPNLRLWLITILNEALVIFASISLQMLIIDSSCLLALIFIR